MIIYEVFNGKLYLLCNIKFDRSVWIDFPSFIEKKLKILSIFKDIM